MKCWTMSVPGEGLHVAALAGDIKTLEQILTEDNVDINCRDSYGNTPLHDACAAEQVNAAVYLLSAGADVNIPDHRGDAPLHAAVRAGNHHLVKILLKDGSLDLNKPGRHKSTPLHLATGLQNNRLEICETLLSHGADVQSLDFQGVTPVGVAALKGFLDTLKFFFVKASESGISDQTLLTPSGDHSVPLLHLAVQSGQIEVLKFCLEKGADPSVCKCYDGSTAIHEACSMGFLEAVKELCNSGTVDLNITDSQGQTPLHRAAMFNHDEVVQFILDTISTGQINATDHKNRSALFLSVTNNAVKCVKLLLEKDADLSLAEFESGSTAVHAGMVHTEICKLLLEHADDVVLKKKDKNGWTVMHYAAHKGLEQPITLLVERDKSLASIRNNASELPLHLAASGGKVAAVQQLLQARLEDVNVTDNKGHTSLHCAAAHGHTALVRLLIKTGAVQTCDDRGMSPFHHAASKGSLITVKVLLDADPTKLNIKDEFENTGLHLAARHGHVQVVEYLLSQHATSILLNVWDQNPLDVAIDKKQNSVVMAMAKSKRWNELLGTGGRPVESQIRFIARYMPKVLEELLDQCMERNGQYDTESYKIRYNFSPLYGSGSPEDTPHHLMNVLESIAMYNRAECLIHPTSYKILDKKWRSYGLAVCLFNQILYLIFMLCNIIITASFTPIPRKVIGHKSSSNQTDIVEDTCEANPHDCRWNLELQGISWTTYQVMTYLIMIIVFINLFREMVQFVRQGLSYFTEIKNWSELCLYLVMLRYFFLDERMNSLEYRWSASPPLAQFLAWTTLLLNLCRFNVFGIYIQMMKKVFQTALKVLLLMGLLVCAFGFAFYVMDYELLWYRTLPRSLMSTFMMVLGNYIYESIFLDYRRPLNYEPRAFVLTAMYILFLFSMPIIFMNILVGLAIGDIDEIRRNAETERMAYQVSDLVYLERVLPQWWVKRSETLYCTDFPNAKKLVSERIVSWLVSLVAAQRTDAEPLEEEENLLRTLIEKMDMQENRLNEVLARLDKQTELKLHETAQ